MDECDCTNCVNWKRKVVQEPEPHPGRIFAEDLRIGMVIKRYGTMHLHKLLVILGEGDGHWVPALFLCAGYPPVKQALGLVASGLKPYDHAGWHGNRGKYRHAGSWATGAWCKEVK